MKKLTLTLLCGILLSGCATTKQEAKEVVPNPVEQAIANKNLMADNAIRELANIKAGQRAWTDFKLMAITLDKNKKPVGSKEFEIENVKDALTFPGGPRISLADFTTATSQGKIIQINCKTADIKQKFDTAINLPGWALEMTCDKASYFFMINKK